MSDDEVVASYEHCGSCFFWNKGKDIFRYLKITWKRQTDGWTTNPHNQCTNRVTRPSKEMRKMSFVILKTLMGSAK